MSNLKSSVYLFIYYFIFFYFFWGGVSGRICIQKHSIESGPKHSLVCRRLWVHLSPKNVWVVAVKGLTGLGRCGCRSCFTLFDVGLFTTFSRAVSRCTGVAVFGRPWLSEFSGVVSRILARVFLGCIAHKSGRLAQAGQCSRRFFIRCHGLGNWWILNTLVIWLGSTRLFLVVSLFCRFALFVRWLQYSFCPLATLSTVIVLSLGYSTRFVLWLHLVQYSFCPLATVLV